MDIGRAKQSTKYTPNYHLRSKRFKSAFFHDNIILFTSITCRAQYSQLLLLIYFSSRDKDVIFNNPVTVVFWEDGTKTIVRCQEGDTYSKEAGLAMAIVKKLYGNSSSYYDKISKWTGER